MEDAAAIDDEGVGVGAGLDAEGEVLLELAVEAVLDVTRGHVFAVLAEEWRIVDGEEHRHRGLVHRDRRKGFRILGIGDGVADLEAFDADHGADVAAAYFFDLALAEAVEDHQLLDLRFLDDVIPLAEAHLHAGAE